MPSEESSQQVSRNEYTPDDFGVDWFHCPWCDYQFRKERYFGRHVWENHAEVLVKDE